MKSLNPLLFELLKQFGAFEAICERGHARCNKGQSPTTVLKRRTKTLILHNTAGRTTTVAKARH